MESGRPIVDKHTYAVWKYDDIAGTSELVGVEVTVDWSMLNVLAHAAARNKRGRATAYYGAITARVLPKAKS